MLIVDVDVVLPGCAPPIGGAVPTRSVTIPAPRRPGSPYGPGAAEMLTTLEHPFLRVNVIGGDHAATDYL